MNQRTLRTVVLGAILAGLATAAAAPLLSPPTDYTSLPPKPADVEQKLNGMKGGLARAIAAAEDAVKGVARSAAVRIEADPVVVEVIAYGGGGAHRVVVDAATGAVQSISDVPRLPGDPVGGEGTRTASGLTYWDLVVGDGPVPSGSSAVVKVHYTGWLVTGDKFDSSVDRGKPATFPLSGVIPGWTEGVASMHVGGKRKLVIPYPLAYGERGRPGAIPPKATLVFDVELLEIVSE